MKNILNLLTRPYLAAALLLMLGATAVLLSSLPASLGSLAPSPSKQLVYVSGQLGISTVDIQQGWIVDRIPVNGRIGELHLNSSGTHLYARVITDTIPRNSVAVFDTASNQLLDSIALSETASSLIYDVAVNPQETRLFSTRLEYQGGPNTLQVMDIASRETIASIPLDGIGPWEIAFSPSGAQAYIVMRGNSGSESGVVFIDTLDNKVLGNLPIEGGLRDLLVSPDGRRAYVGVDAESEVAVIDTVNMTVTTRILGTSPVELALNRDGTRLLVNSGNSTLRVIDTTTNTVEGISWAPLGSALVAANASGDRVFTLRSNALWVIGIGHRPLEEAIQLDKFPEFLAFRP